MSDIVSLFPHLLVPRETAAVSAHVLRTPYNHAPVFHLKQHTHRVPASLAEACHLHVWNNGRDPLRVSAVTRLTNSNNNKQFL